MPQIPKFDIYYFLAATGALTVTGFVIGDSFIHPFAAKSVDQIKTTRKKFIFQMIKILFGIIACSSALKKLY